MPEEYVPAFTRGIDEIKHGGYAARVQAFVMRPDISVKAYGYLRDVLKVELIDVESALRQAEQSLRDMQP